MFFCTTLLPNLYQIYIQDNSYKHLSTSRLENNVDPDQLASEKPADHDLHCFQNMRRFKGFRGGSRISGFRCIKRDSFSDFTSFF